MDFQPFAVPQVFFHPKVSRNKYCLGKFAKKAWGKIGTPSGSGSVIPLDSLSKCLTSPSSLEVFLMDVTLMEPPPSQMIFPPQVVVPSHECYPSRQMLPPPHLVQDFVSKHCFSRFPQSRDRIFKPTAALNLRSTDAQSRIYCIVLL